MFGDTLGSKEAFLDSKITKLKVERFGIFLKGLFQGLGQKFEFFLSFFKKKNRPGKCFC